MAFRFAGRAEALPYLVLISHLGSMGSNCAAPTALVCFSVPLPRTHVLGYLRSRLWRFAQTQNVGREFRESLGLNQSPNVG
jgi:hypothetical protein